MSSYAQLTEQFGTRLLDAVQPTADAVARAVETVDGLLSRLPSVPVLPLSDRLPSRREVVVANFDLAGRLLAAQRDFALRLVQVSPESGRVFVPAQATSPENAAQTVAV